MQTAIVTAVGLNPANARFEHALARLAEQPCLVILDNLETPWREGDPGAIEAILRRLVDVPGLALLVSVRGQVPPRAPRWTYRLDLDPLDEIAARELFRDIAPNITADDPDLGNFLAALGGIPLAIELVAFRAAEARLTTLAELWAEYQRVGAALAARPGVDPSRLTSLPHSIELSLQSRRLGEGGKRLFQLLGQLPAGIAAEDRVALLGALAFAAAEELSAIGLAFGRGDRLDLLPPIRDHAGRFHPPEGEDAAHWHEHYLGLLRDRGGNIGTAEGVGAVERLAPEFANLEAALRAQLAAGLPADAGLTLTGLTRLMSFSGLGSPGLIEALAASCRSAEDRLGEANCVQRLGDIALARSDHDGARAAYERALPLYRQVGQILGEANCVKSLGDIALARSDHDGARAAYRQALALYERIPEPYSIGVTHFKLVQVTDGAERAAHIAAARDAWRSIDRPDLVKLLDGLKARPPHRPLSAPGGGEGRGHRR